MVSIDVVSLLTRVLIREALILGWHFEVTSWPYSITSSSLRTLTVVDSTVDCSGGCGITAVCCFCLLLCACFWGHWSKQSVSLFAMSAWTFTMWLYGLLELKRF